NSIPMIQTERKFIDSVRYILLSVIYYSAKINHKTKKAIVKHDNPFYRYSSANMLVKEFQQTA
ncbi:hypothetical protein ACJX0J_040831, partial [Zea mays]